MNLTYFPRVGAKIEPICCRVSDDDNQKVWEMGSHNQTVMGSSFWTWI